MRVTPSSYAGTAPHAQEDLEYKGFTLVYDGKTFAGNPLYKVVDAGGNILFGGRTGQAGLYQCQQWVDGEVVTVIDARGAARQEQRNV